MSGGRIQPYYYRFLQMMLLLSKSLVLGKAGYTRCNRSQSVATHGGGGSVLAARIQLICKAARSVRNIDKGRGKGREQEDFDLPTAEDALREINLQAVNEES